MSRLMSDVEFADLFRRAPWEDDEVVVTTRPPQRTTAPRKRLVPCMSCSTCILPNCGTCVNCIDRTQRRVRKKRCVRRMCQTLLRLQGEQLYALIGDDKAAAHVDQSHAP